MSRQPRLEFLDNKNEVLIHLYFVEGHSNTDYNTVGPC